MPTHLVSDYLAEAAPLNCGGGVQQMLVSESNHRIANNLTLIAGILRLQANDIVRGRQALSADEVGVMLAEVSSRLETVGRLHRLLAQSGGASHLDLGLYLQAIAEAAMQAMSGANAVLAPPSGASCEIPAQIALSVGFVVGEAVTNAVKYAHPASAPGVVALTCEPCPDGSILIKVEDDGVGLPQGFDPEADGGLGLRMMRTIARQLGAELRFEDCMTGLTVALRLPPNRPVAAS